MLEAVVFSAKICAALTIAFAAGVEAGSRLISPSTRRAASMKSAGVYHSFSPVVADAPAFGRLPLEFDHQTAAFAHLFKLVLKFIDGCRVDRASERPPSALEFIPAKPKNSDRSVRILSGLAALRLVRIGIPPCDEFGLEQELGFDGSIEPRRIPYTGVMLFGNLGDGNRLSAPDQVCSWRGWLSLGSGGRGLCYYCG